MSKIIIELTQKQADNLAQLIDAANRAQGVRVAEVCLELLSIIGKAVQASTESPDDPQES